MLVGLFESPSGMSHGQQLQSVVTGEPQRKPFRQVASIVLTRLCLVPLHQAPQVSLCPWWKCKGLAASQFRAPVAPQRGVSTRFWGLRYDDCRRTCHSSPPSALKASPSSYFEARRACHALCVELRGTVEPCGSRPRPPPPPHLPRLLNGS